MSIAKKPISSLMRWAHLSSGYCKYGLYRDDCLDEYPHVEEALRRLPDNLFQERNHRIVKAMHYSMKKMYLPENQWVSIEEDLEKGRYLQPYIEEVLKEIAERTEWAKK